MESYCDLSSPATLPEKTTRAGEDGTVEIDWKHTSNGMGSKYRPPRVSGIGCLPRCASGGSCRRRLAVAGLLWALWWLGTAEEARRSWAHSWDVDERPDGERGNVGSAPEKWVAEVVGRWFVGFPAEFGLCGQCGGWRKMLEVMVRSWGGELVL